MRWKRWPVALLAATLAGTACAGDDNGAFATTEATTGTTATTAASPTSTSDLDGSTSTTPAPTTVAPTTRPPATTVPVDPEDPLPAAAAAFERWVGHLAAGDHQAAWEAMAPTSREAVGEVAFFDDMATGLSEGWGSWSAAEDVEYDLGEDEAGRQVLEVSGTIAPEGMVEDRSVAVPIVLDDGQVLLSPFEEFGNVAEGVRAEIEGDDTPPVPADSGEGRRVVYSNPDQRVWLVEDDGTVVDSYLVSGKDGVPAPGTYEVFSRSETAFAGHDDITMRYMVRFAHGENLAIGFHAIPNDGNGEPLQTEEALGEFHSAGCVRQSTAHAEFLYEWAPQGTTVVVLG